MVACGVCVAVVLVKKGVFQRAAMLVSPSLLHLSNICQVCKAGVECAGWGGYRHVRLHCTELSFILGQIYSVSEQGA